MSRLAALPAVRGKMAPSLKCGRTTAVPGAYHARTLGTSERSNRPKMSAVKICDTRAMTDAELLQSWAGEEQRQFTGWDFS